MKTEKTNLYVVTIPLRAELVQRGDTEGGATEAAAKKLKEIFNSLPELSAFIRIEGGGEALKASNGVNGHSAKASHADEDAEPPKTIGAKKGRAPVKAAADDDDEDELHELDSDDDDGDNEEKPAPKAMAAKKAGGVKMSFGPKGAKAAPLAVALDDDDDADGEEDEDLAALDEDDDDGDDDDEPAPKAKAAEKPKTGGLRVKFGVK